MSQLRVESHDDPVQATLYGMQYSVLPLLHSLDTHGEHINRAGAQLLHYRNEIGRLIVSHNMELLHVRVTDSVETTPTRDRPCLESEESIGWQTEYQMGPDGVITPTALYSRLSFAARIHDEGKRQTGRYIPKYMVDRTTLLESDVFGPLSESGLMRLQEFVGRMVVAATEFAQDNDRAHLQLVPPIPA